jgi:putative toxin-antitoxin system antitoxin component (TIGR02293 family)
MNGSTAVLDVTPRQALDRLEKALGIAEEELAQALNSNRRTLQRWRMGAAYPQQMARQRLADLLRVQQRVRHVFEGRESARRWFHSESRYLGGMTPAEAIRVGRLDRVEAALEALDSGVFV